MGESLRRGRPDQAYAARVPHWADEKAGAVRRGEAGPAGVGGASAAGGGGVFCSPAATWVQSYSEVACGAWFSQLP